MRTTVRLDDRLLAEAKHHAARTGRSLTQLIEDALREVLARAKPERGQTRTRLPTMGGRGVQPGVDLDNSGALLDLMDRDG
jgi:hypothetical protein